MYLVTAALAVSVPPLGSQGPGTVGGRSEVFAGSELENYLRVLQLGGAVPLYPWAVRAFSARELDRLAPRDTAAHPWAGRYEFRHSAGARLAVDLVRPTLSVRVNTTFPYGLNDGPIWAGRGPTSAAQVGFSARWRAFSVTVAPMVIRAENGSFPLLPNGQTGAGVYADGLYPGGIDRPQRFGDAPYELLDPGQSTVRVDAHGLVAGVSTANQYWGPATEFPIVLGNNAAGFPHAFLGTAEPVELWLLRVHARLVWGRLAQSPFSVQPGAGLRFMAGAVGVLTSRWVPGLEVGVSRFSHSPWPGLTKLSLSDVLIPLRSQYRRNVGAAVPDNQFASVFFRWVLPSSGLDVYAEYGREDYNQNLRDLVQEPDHWGGYTIGFRKALHRSGARITALRAELQDLQLSVLALGRDWLPFYIHGAVPQGHTQRGQVLGSEAGFGGAASAVVVESYHSAGRWMVAWHRLLRQNRSDFPATGLVDRRALDVQHALSVGGLFFRGRYDVTAGLTAVYEFNRNFGKDAFNVNAIVGIRADVKR